MAVWGGLSYFRYPEGGYCGGGADVVACVAEFIGAQGGHVCLDLPEDSADSVVEREGWVG